MYIDDEGEILSIISEGAGGVMGSQNGSDTMIVDLTSSGKKKR